MYDIDNWPTLNIDQRQNDGMFIVQPFVYYFKGFQFSSVKITQNKKLRIAKTVPYVILPRIFMNKRPYISKKKLIFMI